MFQDINAIIRCTTHNIILLTSSFVNFSILIFVSGWVLHLSGVLFGSSTSASSACPSIVCSLSGGATWSPATVAPAVVCVSACRHFTSTSSSNSAPSPAPGRGDSGGSDSSSGVVLVVIPRLSSTPWHLAQLVNSQLEHLITW